LAGSLFGIQLGAIGTTYVKPYMVKLVMGVIMVLVLFSRGTVIPVYLSDLDMISKITPETANFMKNISFGLLIFALATGAFIVLSALLKGMRLHRAELAADASAHHFSATPTANLASTARFERLLLVVDNSKFSTGAIHEAIQMAKRCQSKLHVLTILPDVEHDSLAHPVLKQEREAALQALVAVQQQAQAAGIDCEIMLGHGDAHQEIVEEAEHSRMDVIIMGRRDKSDLLRSMMGSTTQKVIADTHSKVLVVPHHATFAGKGVILPVDGSRHSDAAATAVLSLVKHDATPVTVVAVAAEPRQAAEARANAERIQTLFKQAGVDASLAVRTGTPETEIVAIANEMGDLIVMGSHGSTGLDRLLVGSVSERVIGQAQCPVLVVK